MEDQYQSNVQPNPGGSGKGKTWLVILSGIVIAVVTAGGVYFWQQSVVRNKAAQQQAEIDALNSKIAELNKKVEESNGNTTTSKNTDSKEYTDGNISFNYPKEWIAPQLTSENKTEGVVFSARSQATDKKITNDKTGEMYCCDVEVSYWKDINNQYAQTQQTNPQKTYADLKSFLDSSTKPANIQKLGIVKIDSVSSYELIIGGMGENYALMIEKEGIYRIDFPSAANKSYLSEEQKKLIESIKFK